MAGEEAAHLEDMPKRPPARLLRAAEAKAWQDGFAFLERAEHQGREMREAARRAYASEYAQGYEDGKRAGEAEAASLLSETVVKVDRYLAGLESEVVGLAVDIVRRVLGDFDVGELVARAARQAIADVRRAKHLKITVHPDAAAAVRAELDGALTGEARGFTIELNTDASLAVGGCILSTDAAVIDAGIDTQLDAIASVLRHRREGQP